jgi:hypothetical protein
MVGASLLAKSSLTHFSPAALEKHNAKIRESPTLFPLTITHHNKADASKWVGTGAFVKKYRLIAG